ncbi:MAG: acetyl-CoA carboxylase biotin carboxyl carrier protein subunit [Anaerolineaceae bacterium]|nr:acetyl-CoA carboxylase biotin carboxyl carrier protein subunit [Anaerolineaceae bacterium]
MRYRYQNRGQIYEITVERKAGVYQALVDGHPYQLEILDSQPGQMSLRLSLAAIKETSGRSVTLYWANDGSSKWISVDGCSYRLDKPGSRSSHVSAILADREGSVRAPMPAQVRAINITQGDRVEKGHTLLLLEAMKMEIRIKAPTAGRVTRLLVTIGQAVEKDQFLVQIGGE